MLNKALLHKIQAKHPEYTQEEIKVIIMKHLLVLNFKLGKSDALNLTIPRLGRIHIHGNAISDTRIKFNRRVNKFLIKKNAYSDKRLLF